MYSSTGIDASNFVSGVDTAFMVILGIAFFFLISITATMIYFIIRYNKKRNPKAKQIKGSTKLEIVWTVVPTILVMVMFYFGWAGWRPMQNPPNDAMEIETIARMWSFTFKYDNGKITDTLYVPQDRAVKLNLVSLDVIHSLYIPAFRVKQDMVPGKENQFMWFTPRSLGDYDLFCAEYCGLQHSYMYSGVKVLPQEEFDIWYSDTTQVLTSATASPEQIGLQILRNNGCNACHSTDGSKLVGPSYRGSFGATRLVETGGETREIIVDEEYIKKSIYDPNADIVDGYSKGLMLSYKDLITEEELEDIILYIKSLNDE
jgi:cytochrome c oxidase subunit 2